MPTSGVVDDVMADHVAGAVRRAESDGAAAVIIQLDTLGGSEEAMQRITSSLHSKIPTIVWVGPVGAKAASAGTFITLSAEPRLHGPEHQHRGGLAGRGRRCGHRRHLRPDRGGQGHAGSPWPRCAASPRNAIRRPSTGRSRRSRAPSPIRAQEGARRARDQRRLPGSLDDVLNQADGQTVTTSAGSVVVHTKGASIVTIDEDVIQSFLHTLDDPNIAFILLVIGVLCVADRVLPSHAADGPRRGFVSGPVFLRIGQPAPQRPRASCWWC